MTQYYFLIGLGGNVDAIHSSLHNPIKRNVMTQYYFLIGLGGNVDVIHSMQPKWSLDVLDIPAHSKHNEMKNRTYQIMHPHPSASFALSLLHNPKRSPMSCSISKQQPRYKGITQMIYVSLKHPLPQIQQHKTNDLCLSFHPSCSHRSNSIT